MHESLRSLQLAMKGKTLLTPELEEVYESFLSQRVPVLWQVRAAALPRSLRRPERLGGRAGTRGVSWLWHPVKYCVLKDAYIRL